MHLRTPRLDVGLLSFETAAFTGTAVYLFTQAVRESRDECPPDSFCIDLDFGPMLGGTGVLSLGMAAWSTALLIHSVRELRWRRANGADRPKSLRRNRLMIPYDSLMTLGYVGFAVPFSIAPSDERPLPAATAAGAVMAGLHVWSLVLNAKELKRRKRLGNEPMTRKTRPPAKRIQIMGSGVQW